MLDKSEIYQEALNIFIKQWNDQHHIQQDKISQPLSRRYIEDLLSKIARNSWERGEYFFKEEAIEKQISQYIRSLPDAIEKQISQYIRSLPDSNKNLEMEIDSEAVLKLIQAQNGLLVERARGIYSFSHINFQEYLAGKDI